jgi:Na+-driven multidrug efflux pump
VSLCVAFLKISEESFLYYPENRISKCHGYIIKVNIMQNPLLKQEQRQTTNHFTQVVSFYNSVMPMLNEINEKFIPQALSDFGLDAGNIVNVILLSQLPPQEDSSAAAAIISTAQVAMVVIFSAFLYVLAPVIQYYMPAHKSAVISASVLFALILSVPGFIASFFMGDIFFQLGVKASVCDIVDEYFSVFAFALPCWMAATALNKTAMPLKHEQLMYVESLINLIGITGFSTFFVKFYPLPYFSPVQTIALSYLVCALPRIMLYVIAYKRADLLEDWAQMNVSRYQEAMMHMWSIGWRLCLQLTSELAALYVLTLLAPLLLPNQTMNLAILNVMIQSFSFSIIITLAMAMTAMTIVGELCNNKEYASVRPNVHTLLAMSTAYNLVLFAIIMAIPNPVANLFMNVHDNTNTGLSGDFRSMFAITFLGLIFNAYKDIINMAQRSLQMYSLPMKVSVGGVWGIGMPLAIIFATCTNLEIGGLWLGYNLGNIITGLFLLVHWDLVSQQNVVVSIFTDGSNIVHKLDSISYCFSEYKERFFHSSTVSQEYTSLTQSAADYS